MEPLTPNTSAFLSYLAESVDNNNINNNPVNQINPFDAFSSFDSVKNPSFPPSAFFPIPGRDTPEDTPPSSTETNQSPDKQTSAPNTGFPISDSDGDSPHQVGKKATHKRKAGQGHVKHEEEDEEEDDSASDFATGHEDKRAHPNEKATKKGGRKSVGGEEGKGGKDNKAARRKEQNRAAQKAFRERREAKVKDVSVLLGLYMR